MNTKALRQKVLDLAIHGKLVPQNPNDESATVLLEKIRAEKAEKIKKGELKADKKDSFIFVGSDKRHYEQFADGTVKDIEDEIPFDVPEGWAWCRLNQIYNFIDYRGVTPNKIDSGVPLVTAKNVKNGYIDYSISEFISKADYEKRQGRGSPRKGDLLFTTEAPLGNCAIADLDIFSPGQRIITFQQYTNTEFLNNKLFLYFILSDKFQELIYNKRTGTTVTGIKAEKLKLIFIPLPPKKEQDSIISVIENIYLHINSIEKSKLDLQEIIKQTKSKILDLAIHGKLVPQDPKDEPAEELLNRIATSDNRPYEKFEFVDDNSILPNGWVATQMGTYIEFTGGAQPPKETFEYTKTENNIRLIQIRDYKTDDYATYIPKNLARRTCSKTDIMIGRYGPPLFQILRGIEGAYNVALMKAESKVFCNDYLFYMLQDEKLLHFLESLSDRTCGQDGVNMYELKRYPILVPPLAEQHRIVSKIEELFSYLDTISSNLE